MNRALKVFYHEIDPDQAGRLLQEVLSKIREVPCVLIDVPLRRQVAESGLLLLRLLLMEGRPEAASEVLRDLLHWFDPGELPMDHVPPEVSGFLENGRQDRLASAISVTLRGPEGWVLLIDGLPLRGPEGRLPPGRHRLDLLSDEEAYRGTIEVTGPTSWSFQEDLSRVYRPGPGGVLEVFPGTGEDQDRRLSEFYQVDVLRLRWAEGRARAELTASTDHLPRQEVLWVDVPDSEKLQLQVTRKGMLVPQVPWYWAPISGGLSVALLVAGIVLNVQAERNLDQIREGSDRLNVWRSQRQGSIACYTVGAASGAAAAILTWAIHRKPARTIIQVPMTESWAISSLPGGPTSR